MARTQDETARTDDDYDETIVADGGSRQTPTDPAKALLEDAAGL